MPRAFEVEVSSAVTAEQVFDAFSDPRYWRDRFTEFDTSMKLDDHDIDADGAVRIVATQDLRSEAMPTLLAKVFPARVEIRTTEIWRPAASGHVTGQIGINAIGVPGSGQGSATITPTDPGSAMRVCGSVNVNVPLLGGKVEGRIAKDFVEHIPQLQRFTTEWIGSHG